MQLCFSERDLRWGILNTILVILLCYCGKTFELTERRRAIEIILVEFVMRNFEYDFGDIIMLLR